MRSCTPQDSKPSRKKGNVDQNVLGVVLPERAYPGVLTGALTSITYNILDSVDNFRINQYQLYRWLCQCVSISCEHFVNTIIPECPICVFIESTLKNRKSYKQMIHISLKVDPKNQHAVSTNDITHNGIKIQLFRKNQRDGVLLV